MLIGALPLRALNSTADFMRRIAKLARGQAVGKLGRAGRFGALGNLMVSTQRREDAEVAKSNRRRMPLVSATLRLCVKTPDSARGERLEFGDHALERALGVAVEHAGVGHQEELVFQPGETGALAALEADAGARFMRLADRHEIGRAHV